MTLHPLLAVALVAVALVAVALVAAGAASAQPVRLGTLVQVDAVAGDGAEAFALPSARLRAHAAVDGVALFAQADLAREAVLLDARLAVPLGSGVTLEAGRFKTPFGGEFLTFRGDLVLAERSRVVRALAPGRSVGAALGLEARGARVEAGLFEDPAAGGEGGGLLAVARVAGLDGAPLAVGADLAVGRATPLTVGADARLAAGPLRLLAEAAAAPAADTLGVRGGLAVTGDLRVEARTHALARLDVVETAGGLDARLDVGAALEARPHLRFLADYGFPAARPDRGALTLRLQLAVR